MIMADIALWLITAVLCTLHLERASSSSQQQDQRPSFIGETPIENGYSTQKRYKACQRCEVYRFKHCAEVTSYYNTTDVSIDCGKSLIDLDTTLRQISSSLYTNHGAEINCLKGSRWALCLTVMRPGCHNGSLFQKVLCKEACELIKDDICKTEWSEVINRIEDGYLNIDNIFPDCSKFPSVKSPAGTASCFYPQALQQLRKSKAGDKDNEKKQDSLTLILSAAGGGLGLVIILVILLLSYRRCKMQSNRQARSVSMRNIPKSDFFDGMTAASTTNDAYDEDNPLYNKTVHFEDMSLEKISRERLKYIEPIAEGAFGKVVKCELSSPIGKEPKLAAVKYLKDDASEKVKHSFKNEAETIGSFDHPNIVALLGVCIDDKGPPCMVLEFMELGDLTNYIRDRSGSFHASFGRNGILPEEVEFKPPKISFKDLIGIARQIASGMAYLAERKFVHRDLATRNCLVNNKTNIKIADFGLAHDVSSAEHDYYRIDGQHLLPIRWLPPEALTVGKFTIQSDIWAFGVVLWELFTYGIQPFYGQSNEEVCDRIRCMKLLRRPDGCPQRVYQLMKSCWKYDPMKRLPFSKLYETLTMWTLTGKGHFLEDAWSIMLKPLAMDRAPTLPFKRGVLEH
ncbi:muscle, skeletal receptor tyrosine-protein kinase-like isoform X2 [Rhopilema esculentum]|uniref:muscle, skeletal receptor tyrosine-protein kinase-like isoform X2 n=1 Tax=Rhopilema esculentum TaxID=499914 RepID=UPI0031D99BEE